MSARDAWEYASFVITTLALPFAIVFFAWEQRKERDNEEEEGYQLLSDAYNDFLKVVLANPDLHLRTNEPLENPTTEQTERMLVIFDMLISLFERAYLVAWKPKMSETEIKKQNGKKAESANGADGKATAKPGRQAASARKSERSLN